MNRQPLASGQALLRRLPQRLRPSGWSCLAGWLLLCSGNSAVAVAAPNITVPSLDTAVLQTQAPGYSRLLVTRRSPLPGSILNTPPPHVSNTLNMAYESSLGNNQYTIKLFENLPMSYLQAVARAVAAQPDILTASVLNDHDKGWYGVEMNVPLPAIHSDQAYDLYIPRKGGQKAPVVLILGCVGGDMPVLPGTPRQLMLPFLATAAAEQYGAVVACMSPAESEADLTHQSPAKLTTLTARQAANDAAIKAVLASIGQLTGANTLRVKLVGGQTVVPQDGPAIALHYAFTYPMQVDRLVLDGNFLPPIPQLPAPSSTRQPSSRPVQLGVTALLMGNGLQPNSSWLQGVQQLAAQRHLQVQPAIQSYQDCSADIACAIGTTAEVPTLFSALFGPPPSGTALLSLYLGPDRQTRVGSAIDLPELISGLVLDQAGSNQTPGQGWTAADGSALPAGASVVKVHLGEQLQFIPQQPGHYAFRLRVQDVKGNQAQAYANVDVPNPAPPSTRIALTVSGHTWVAPGSKTSLQAKITGSARPSDILYEWQQTGGPAVALPVKSLPVLQFTAPARAAVLTFKLTASDPSGQVATCIFTQPVKLPPAKKPVPKPQPKPVATPKLQPKPISIPKLPSKPILLPKPATKPPSKQATPPGKGLATPPVKTQPKPMPKPAAKADPPASSPPVKSPAA